MKSIKILITGGAGYVGGVIVDLLLRITWCFDLEMLMISALEISDVLSLNS